jgi:uncharacterized protein (DUF433 family)
MLYKEFIEICPEKRFGQPCIVNTRITVFDILINLANGMTKEEILEDFPELKPEHLVAALSFAAEREHSYKIIS